MNPLGASAVREVEVEEPGLHPREPVLGSHLEDPLHLGGDHDEGVADRGGGAGEAGPRAARHHREAVRGRDADAGLDVLGGVGEGHERASALDERGVAAVEPAREGVGEHLGHAQRGFQLEACGVDVGHGG